MRILIVDDHTLFRRGFSLLLQRLYPETEIEEASDLADALAVVGRVPVDLILLDLAMPGTEGFAGLEQLRDLQPGAAIVIVSAINDADRIREALERGARGYVIKTINDAALKHALSLVLSGETYVPAELLQERPLKGFAAREGADNPLAHLTDRQRDVLGLLMTGQSNKEIARDLGLLESTVKAHIKVILNKLSVANRTQAAMVATTLGLQPARPVQGS
ncbi:MAG TPA: response regulator transcription factor [Hypericibacter adhaerens]|jgi:DNA-binding NarL/FixJ family response regulator|uniref:DNA-binding response regulator n=1 Tax=Hypericibacter adhaerens TaxID=2602016 RepID=A0A5J6N613_9PROT|nr:response regulator transcription factor [Hypericibacter adhaerens]QEX24877.1 DNA-binding response regulator [Hypericibacter adhaerens]HWA45134.1 response regulator transcription factor [Hypericibacter adhaerens]